MFEDVLRDLALGHLVTLSGRTMLPMVELRLLTDGDYEAALAVHVPEDQEAFVADDGPVALVILGKAHVGRWGLTWEALGIFEAELVGLVGLAFTADDDEARFFHLVVSAEHQGKGVGRAAVKALIARAADAGCKILTLTVSPRNGPAMDLYRSLGFLPSGQHIEGEEVWALMLPAS